MVEAISILYFSYLCYIHISWWFVKPFVGFSNIFSEYVFSCVASTS